jgi:hypothetical protein
MPAEVPPETPVELEIVVPPLRNLKEEYSRIQDDFLDSESGSDIEANEDLFSYEGENPAKDKATNPLHIDAFKDALYQFESNILWSAVIEQFTYAREIWQEQLQQADDVASCAQRLVEFCGYLKREIISDLEYVSGDWIEQFHSPDLDIGNVCGLLLELEETLPESAFSESWPGIVDRWKEGLEHIERVVAGEEDYYGYDELL